MAASRVEYGPGAPLPLILKILIITLFLPEGMSFFVAGLRLTVTRAILLGLTPVVLMRLAKMMQAGRYRFVWSDLVVPITGLVMFIGPAVNDGLFDSLQHAGPIALEFFMGYMATRILLTQHGQALSLIELLCRVVAVIALIGLLDPIFNHYVMHDLAQMLTGYQKRALNVDYRLGLLRAMSTLEHAILFGFACGLSILFASILPFKQRGWLIGAAAVGLFFSFSSAPIESVFIGFVLMTYNNIMKTVNYRWALLIGTSLAAVSSIFLIVDSPFGYIFRHLIFDTESGYFRLWVWNVVGDAVLAKPWIGFGFTTGISEYTTLGEGVPLSIDSVWLNSALIFGIPCSALIGVSLIAATSLPVEGPNVDLRPAESKLGTVLGIVMFLVIFMGFTVDFWGSDWILIGILKGVRAHLGALGRLAGRPVPAPADAGLSLVGIGPVGLQASGAGPARRPPVL
jgi:hypothetical protein